MTSKMLLASLLSTRENASNDGSGGVDNDGGVHDNSDTYSIDSRSLRNYLTRSAMSVSDLDDHSDDEYDFDTFETSEGDVIETISIENNVLQLQKIFHVAAADVVIAFGCQLLDVSLLPARVLLSKTHIHLFASLDSSLENKSSHLQVKEKYVCFVCFESAI